MNNEKVQSVYPKNLAVYKQTKEQEAILQGCEHTMLDLSFDAVFSCVFNLVQVPWSFNFTAHSTMDIVLKTLALHDQDSRFCPWNHPQNYVS